MAQEFADGLSSAMCREEASAIIDRAAKIATDGERIEYLKLAVEWLRLASEIQKANPVRE